MGIIASFTNFFICIMLQILPFFCSFLHHFRQKMIYNFISKDDIGSPERLRTLARVGLSFHA